MYAKLWLKAIDEEETQARSFCASNCRGTRGANHLREPYCQVAEKVRLETGAAVKTDEGEAERNDSGEDETEEDGSDDNTEEGSDESELSDGDMDLDAHQGWDKGSSRTIPLSAAQCRH